MSTTSVHSNKQPSVSPSQLGRRSRNEQGADERDQGDRLIGEHLQAVQSALWRSILVKNTLILSATLISGFLTFIIVDQWIYSFGIFSRCIWVLALAGFTIWWFVTRIVPLIKLRISPEYAAYSVELDEPDLQHSLTSYVTLRNDREAPGLRGIVVRSIGARAARHLTTSGMSMPSETLGNFHTGLFTAGVAAVLILYAVFSPKNTVQTMTRLAAPFAAIAPPSRVTIAEVEPGDTESLFGRPLQISARIKGLSPSESAQLWLSSNSHNPIQFTSPENADVFVATIPPSIVKENFEYQVLAGDATSPTFSVTVRDEPSVNIQEVQYAPHPYTGLSNRTTNVGAIDGLEGTRVTVVAQANRQIVRGRIEFNPRQIDGRTSATAGFAPLEISDDGRTVSATWNLRSGRRGNGQVEIDSYRLRVWDETDTSNPDPIEYPIRVSLDLAPEVRITIPATWPKDVPLGTEQLIEVRAADPDFGLNKVEVRIRRSTRLLQTVQLLSPPENNAQQIRGAQLLTYRFQPDALGLMSGDLITIEAVAYDNRTNLEGNQPDPNVVVSDPVELNIIDRPAPNEMVEDGDGLQQPEPKKSEQDQQQNSGDPSDDSQESGGSGDESADNQSGSGDDQQSGKEESGNNSEQNQGGQAGGGGEAENEQEAEQQQQKNGGGGSSSKNQDSQNGEGQGSGAAEGNNQSSSNSAGNNQDSDSQESDSQDPGNESDNKSGSDSTSSGSESSGTESGQPSGNGKPSDATSSQKPSGPNPSQPQNGPRSPATSDGEAMERLHEYLKERQAEKQKNDAQENQTTNDGDSNNDSPTAGGASPNDRGKGEQKDNIQGGSSRPDPNPQTDQESDPNQDRSGDSGQGNKSESTTQQTESDPRQQDGAGQGSEQQDPRNSSNNSKPSPNEAAGNNSKPNSKNSNSDNANQPRDNASDAGTSDSEESQNTDTTAGSAGNSKDPNGKTQNKPNNLPNGSSDDSNTGTKPEKPQNDLTQQPNSAEQGTKGEGTPEENTESEANPDGSPEKSTAPSGSSKSNPSSKPHQGSSNDQPNQDSIDPSRDGENQPSKSGKDNAQTGSQSNAKTPQDQANQSNNQSANGNAIGNNNSGEQMPGTGASDAAAPPAAPDPVNVEAAKKATDLVLDSLKNQRENPDQELLDRLGWTPDQLRRFVDRWEKTRKLGEQNDPAARQQYEEALKSLGLRPEENISPRSSNSRNDQLRQIQDTGSRMAPPPQFRDAIEAYRRSLKDN